MNVLKKYSKKDFKINNEVNRIICDTIHNYSMISENDRVLLMCSGGPDSTFLLFFFTYS